MTSKLEFIGVAFAFVISGLSALIFARRLWVARSKNTRGKGERALSGWSIGVPRRRTVRGTLFTYALLSAVLVILYCTGAWTFTSVGLTSRGQFGLTAVVGAFSYYLLVYGYGVVSFFFKGREARQRASLQVAFRSLPRARRARCLVMTLLCVFNPAVEELIFRGLLVHQYALLTGNLQAAVLIGALVNTLNHVYQGLRALPFHLAFYGVAVTLLYSPYGLGAAVALHYVADIVPYYRLGEGLAAYRKTRRASRRLAQG